MEKYSDSTEDELQLVFATMEQPKLGQDYLLATDFGLYGVFDGLGGDGGNPARAAQVAAESIEAEIAGKEPESEEEMLILLAEAFITARDDVLRKGEEGSTTATVAWVRELSDGPKLGLAHAGDCRAYILRDDGLIRLTDDQGFGAQVDNCFYGTMRGYRYQMQRDHFSAHTLSSGDRLLLCSDGITGDWEDEQLTDEEIAMCLDEKSPVDAAALLMNMSIKSDDKSIVIVDIP